MYIGSNDGRGLMHCLWEIVDNAVDEALAGHCKQITVTLHPDGSVEVEDDGRGIPVDVEPKTKLTGVEVVMTKLHAGGKFGGGSYNASGGLHGVGASVVNALSSRLDVEVDRGGKIHMMAFRRGVPGVFDGDDETAAFTKKGGLQVVGKCARTKTGTRVRWWADRQVFTKDADYDRDALRDRAMQTTFLVPGPDHLAARQPRSRRPVGGDLPAQGRHRRVRRVPVAGGGSHLGDPAQRPGALPRDRARARRQGPHDAAGRRARARPSTSRCAGTPATTRTLRSFVNVIATPKGGTHVAGFERAIVKVVNDQLRAAKVLRANEDNIAKDDVLEGLTAVVAVRLAEPQFEGQTKEVLGTPAASRIVGNVLTKELTAWLTSPPRGEKAAAKALLDKTANAMRARVAARAHRDTQRRKTALESSALPAKLVDCRSDDVERTELFIVEGDSALGTAKTARNADHQALLPIRGKILNVQKSSLADMLKNTECASIIQVIGAGSGRTFDIDQARYGKVILMSDADVDGAHIRCLLLTLIHRYLKPLLDEGRVFAAVPPLHRVEIINPGSKANEVIYTYSDAEMHAVLKDADKRGRRVKEPVQRYKGLGEMDASQLRETTMDPAHRTLRRITMTDVEAADQVFDLLMGSDVAPRKDFIVEGAASLDRERIDA